MNLKEMSSEKQIGYLRSLLGSEKNSLLSYLALFAFRHHAATKHSKSFTQKPVLRWYLGQLAKEYIRKYFKEAQTNLDNLAHIGLLEAFRETDGRLEEFHLNEDLYPVLQEVLEEVFGKEYIEKVISSAQFIRNPRPRDVETDVEDKIEVRE